MQSTDATGALVWALLCDKSASPKAAAAWSASLASLTLLQNCSIAGPSSDRIATIGWYSGPSCLSITKHHINLQIECFAGHSAQRPHVQQPCIHEMGIS
jgi:hypothetical protein